MNVQARSTIDMPYPSLVVEKHSLKCMQQNKDGLIDREQVDNSGVHVSG